MTRKTRCRTCLHLRDLAGVERPKPIYDAQEYTCVAEAPKIKGVVTDALYRTLTPWWRDPTLPVTTRAIYGHECPFYRRVKKAANLHPGAK
jgi:hypothetical protein